jgi:16S rRNA (cytidine1402-2'-O)-methyltransferase
VIREVIAAGFDVIPSPGASAVLAALVASGLPTDRFVFEGFLPLKKGRKTRWERLAQEERTIVIYESPHRIVRTLGDVLAMLGDRHVAVAREMTKKFEEVERGTVSEVLSRISGKTPRGEYVLVIAGTTYRSDRADDHNDPQA